MSDSRPSHPILRRTVTPTTFSVSAVLHVLSWGGGSVVVTLANVLRPPRSRGLESSPEGLLIRFRPSRIAFAFVRSVLCLYYPASTMLHFDLFVLARCCRDRLRHAYDGTGRHGRCGASLAALTFSCTHRVVLRISCVCDRCSWVCASFFFSASGERARALRFRRAGGVLFFYFPVESTPDAMASALQVIHHPASPDGG